MAPLAKVANVEKFMPRDFITDDGFGITEKCRRYLTPLIQGEDYPTYKDGLPVYVTLKNVAGAEEAGAVRAAVKPRSARMRPSRGGSGRRARRRRSSVGRAAHS